MPVHHRGSAGRAGWLVVAESWRSGPGKQPGMPVAVTAGALRAQRDLAHRRGAWRQPLAQGGSSPVRQAPEARSAGA